MSRRQRKTSNPSSNPANGPGVAWAPDSPPPQFPGAHPSPSLDKSTVAENLPPKRQGKAIRRVSRPLKDTSLQSIVFAFLVFGLFLAAFWTYRVFKAGGWAELFGLAPFFNLNEGARNARFEGKSDGSMNPPSSSNPELKQEDAILQHVSSLASILAIPPESLAVAIHSAVSAHAPSATISSISKSHAADDIVKTLVEGDGKASKPASTGGIWDKIVGDSDGPMEYTE